MVDQLNKFERQSQGRLEEMTKPLISTFIKNYALKKIFINFYFFSSRSSYFNIILCRSVLVYLSDSASLHFMKGVSQEPPSPSARLSSTLSPAHCPSFPPSLQCGSPGPGPQSSPASWPVPPYKKATHGQEVTAGSSSRLSATFLRWHPLPLGSNRHLGITTPSTLECLLFDCKRENTIHSQIQDVVYSIASYYIQE